MKFDKDQLMMKVQLLRCSYRLAFHFLCLLPSPCQLTLPPKERNGRKLGRPLVDNFHNILTVKFVLLIPMSDYDAFFTHFTLL
jgi:hypothetical protein